MPYRNLTNPEASIWEIRAAKKKLREEGHRDVNEDLIFMALKKMDAIANTELTKTKSVRKMEARRKTWEKAKEHTTPPLPSIPSELENLSAFEEDIFSQPIKPFDDIEEAK